MSSDEEDFSDASGSSFEEEAPKPKVRTRPPARSDASLQAVKASAAPKKAAAAPTKPKAAPKATAAAKGKGKAPLKSRANRESDDDGPSGRANEDDDFDPSPKTAPVKGGRAVVPDDSDEMDVDAAPKAKAAKGKASKDKSASEMYQKVRRSSALALTHAGHPT